MRSRTLTVLFASALTVGCGSSDDTDPTTDTGDAFEVSTNITEDTTWTRDNVYLLQDHIFVMGATLTIEAGTEIRGFKGTSLVVTPDGRIDAQGTADAPVVFTSAQPVGFRAPGDWGGVVLLGKAPTNVGENHIEGYPRSDATKYGGSDASHDCGSIQYTRIEFAGFKLSDGNEINGLTLGGCGNQTVLDFIQVHKGADDGIEFFGGTADLRHAVITQVDDDGLDGDLGWTGRVQYLVIQQNAVVGNYAIEISNNEDVHTATPMTSPTILNATLIGSDAEPGTAGKTQTPMRAKEGTGGLFINFVIAHFADSSIDVTDAQTVVVANMGGLSVENSVFFDNANDVNNGWPNDFESSPDNFDEAAFFSAMELGNSFEDPSLTAPRNLTAPNFLPTEGAAVLAGGGAVESDAFFESPGFRGAVGTDNWLAGWTAYPEN